MGAQADGPRWRLLRGPRVRRVRTTCLGAGLVRPETPALQQAHEVRLEGVSLGVLGLGVLEPPPPPSLPLFLCVCLFVYHVNELSPQNSRVAGARGSECAEIDPSTEIQQE